MTRKKTLNNLKVGAMTIMALEARENEFLCFFTKKETKTKQCLFYYQQKPTVLHLKTRNGVQMYSQCATAAV